MNSPSNRKGAASVAWLVISTSTLAGPFPTDDPDPMRRYREQMSWLPALPPSYRTGRRKQHSSVEVPLVGEFGLVAAAELLFRKPQTAGDGKVAIVGATGALLTPFSIVRVPFLRVCCMDYTQIKRIFEKDLFEGS